jgi:hypothetical protein
MHEAQATPAHLRLSRLFETTSLPHFDNYFHPTVSMSRSSTTSFSMIGGGRGIFCRKMVVLIHHGVVTNSSCEMNCFVGTEKTSARLSVYFQNTVREHQRTIQLLECQLLRLAHEAEDHEPRDQIESSIEADCNVISQARGDVIPIRLQAPVGVMTVVIRGKVKLSTPAVIHWSAMASVNQLWSSPTKCVVDAHSPCHSLLTLNRREHFRRVLESYWAFTQRICDCEEVDEATRSTR